MATYKQEDALCVLTIDTPMLLVAAAWKTLYEALRVYKTTVPLTQVKFDLQPTALTYKYVVKHADGRQWKQTIVFAAADDTDPTMTFDIAPAWKMSEFTPGRAVRDELVKLVVEYKLTKDTTA